MAKHVTEKAPEPAKPLTEKYLQSLIEKFPRDGRLRSAQRIFVEPVEPRKETTPAVETISGTAVRPHDVDPEMESAKSPASGRRLVVPDAATPGLVLRITENGAMSWLVRYRPKGQAQKGATLGPYPTITLADARERALEIVAAAKKGRDLIEEEERQKEAKERARARARTMAEVAPDFLRASEHLKSYRQRKSYMNNHILPAMGNRPVGEVRRADVVELLDEIEHKRGLRQTVNRVRETLVAFFEYAIERELVDANPAAGARRRRKLERKRRRMLNPDEIRALWNGLDSLRDPVPAFVRTLMLTGCRRENARAMRWSEIEDGVWTVPGDKAKNERPYEIPLSKQMRELLEGVKRAGPFVFTRDGERPFSGMSDLKKEVDKASGVSNWIMHDLRRTLRTGIARLGVIYEVAERVIGRSMSKLEETYNLHAYRVEKADVNRRWNMTPDRRAILTP
jgi:integrase